MPVEPITLEALARVTRGRIRGDGDVVVSDVTHDSRAAGRGVLFVAVRGLAVDGHRFIPAAIAAGSPAVCVATDDPHHQVPTLVVEDTRVALAPLAATVQGHPAEALRLVGVTGTNGKTTVTHLVESICRAAAIPEAVAGTIGARIRGRAVPMTRTTPEATDFQRLLRTMVDAGVDVAAVEVSSHALALGRVAETRFRVGAFTNLSQDHLDFHGDMDSYERAKAQLFRQCDEAVVWVDDAAGARIARSLSIPVATVGTGTDGDLRVRDAAHSFSGSDFVLESGSSRLAIHVPLAGGFNVANAAVAAACARALGVDDAAIAAGIAAVDVVPGRFERVATDADFTVIVDYAHTPEGVAAVIDTALEILGGTGRVIALVGAGGDRDRAKRPLMGAAASRAHIAVLTSDNPRSERPEDILAEVTAGARGPATVIIEIDRRRAIAAAIEQARPGDVVLVLGKGHEQTQDFGDHVEPFDDRLVAAAAVRAR
ncbi:MAG: UDP-N-acetylmuramoyl-L-alanyl-D-glutamate--2,6-diaminopimelate ligase [Acidimicrobiia bacterium]|nr:UDP-N-acetylmuramoyl-L-alanyl-D-glutamate--2,6-diaminopimelate ligase [Acidimicrobiia bacterium]